MKRSVIVDGDKDFIAFAERQLVLSGYQVSTFTDFEQFLKYLRANTELVIIGDKLSGKPDTLDCIRAARKAAAHSFIIHIGNPNESNQAAHSVAAGASEFIERNTATFVRLRTSLDQQNGHTTNRLSSILHNLKKVFIG